MGALAGARGVRRDSPVAPPLLPEDRKLRDQIIALRSQLAALRLDPERMLAREPELIAAAQKLGWKPLVAEVAAAAGTAAQRTGDLDTARARFQAAADEAVRLADFKLEASARIGLLEVELDATGEPSNADRAAKLLEQATDAVQRAGNDPALESSIENLHATYDAARGEYGVAIDRYDRARTRLLALGVLRVAVITTAQELRALELRDGEGDLDTAWRLGLETEQALAASPRTMPRGALAAVMIELAWRRGDLDEAHARADGDDRVVPPGDTVAIAGVVVGPDHAPVAGARVIAWRGTLAGDATRANTRADFPGAIATTDDAGAFHVEAPAGGALIAEHGALRSAPIAAIDHARLVIGPTRAIAGHVDAAAATDLDAFARFEVRGGASWQLETPVARDRTYWLVGIPAGHPILGLERTAWGGQRDIVAGPAKDGATLAWPRGPALDVIVRGVPAGADALVVVTRGRAIPNSRTELMGRVLVGNVAVAGAESVGIANTTREGLATYARGDRHAVVRDNAPGEVTACAVWQRDPHAAPTCAVVTIAATATTIVTVLAAR